MKKYWRELLLIVTVLIIIFPLFYFKTPYAVSGPDIFYVKAKLFHVLQGKIFADPITGYNTLHPPFYYIFVGLFKIAGINLDIALILITAINLVLLYLFTFKIITQVYDREIAFYVTLLLLFIVNFMGRPGILLATSFNFSIPFYLCGLWLYLISSKSLRLTIIASISWGLAFFVSPVYLFLIGLTFLYEWLIAGRSKRFLYILAVFLVTISPYIIGAVNTYLSGLWGSQAFALWRGIPDLAWWKKSFLEFISPAKGEIFSIATALHVLYILLALITIIRQKKVFWFIPVATMATFLTFYHFSPQYGMRIHLFLSIFIVALALMGLRRYKIKKYMIVLPVLAILAFSLYSYLKITWFYFEREKATFATYQESGKDLWANLDNYLEENQYLFCTKYVYRYYIMTYFPAHSLGAYRTLEYFQINSRIADMLENDYNAVMYSTDYDFIENVADKYDIETAVISGDDWQLPIFQILSQQWTLVYHGEYFSILRRRPK